MIARRSCRIFYSVQRISGCRKPSPKSARWREATREKALNVLVGVMGSNNATPAARVAAANAILDRGWGKATQAIESGDGGALELIHRIERVIVHSENSDSKSFEPLLKPHRYKGIWGGRGSGNLISSENCSVEMCQAERGMLAVCIREAQRTLAQSSKRLIESKIGALGLGHGFKSFSDRIETPWRRHDHSFAACSGIQTNVT